MCYRSKWNNFSRAGATVLLAVVFLTCAAQLLAQQNTGAQQPKAATEKTDSGPLEDLSKWPGLLFAFQGGGGWFGAPDSSPTAYSGIKLGGNGFVVDLGYDRILSHSGASGELSAMLPLFRFPGPQRDETRNYLSVYAEPGFGYRVGKGAGVYASAKLIAVLFSDKRLTTSGGSWSPYIQLERRFPSTSPLDGDNRIAIGIMWAICEHCGLE